MCVFAFRKKFTTMLHTSILAFLAFCVSISSFAPKPIASPQREELITTLARQFPDITNENLDSELEPWSVVKGKPALQKEFAVFDAKLRQQFKTMKLKKAPYWKLKNHPGIDILYMEGTGWHGAIWGYLILDEAQHSVVDVFFFHKGETRTYGAEIGLDWFQEQFVGMQLAQDGQLVKLEMPNREKYSHGGKQIDAISGSTITNRGVMGMFNGMLANYQALLVQGH